MSVSFTWLHLTDFHCGMKEQGWRLPICKKIFFEDLNKLHDKSGPWDLVLFTGDITQKGSVEQFQNFDTILINELWEKLKELGSDPKFLAVPGNHDLVRPSEEEMTDPSFLTLKTLEQQQRNIQNRFWSEPEYSCRQSVCEIFKNYTAWWKGMPYKPEGLKDGILPGDFSVTIEKEGIKIGLIGLNTAFLQMTQEDYEGKLALHSLQIEKVCEENKDAVGWVNNHHACLLLTHHPQLWLSPYSLRYYEEYINPPGRFVVHLCGHTHDTIYTNIMQSGTEKTRRLWQTLSLFGLEHFQENTHRIYGYSVGRIEIKEERKGILFFYPRRAVSRKGGGMKMIPDYESVDLNDNQHTKIETFELNQPYILNDSQFVSTIGDNGSMQDSNEIEFINRIDELGKITHKYSPQHLLISAPAGYGKTRLIKVSEDKLKELGWYCVHIELSERDKAYPHKTIASYIFKQLVKDNYDIEKERTLQDLGSEIGFCIFKVLDRIQNKKFVLIVDQAEYINSNVVKPFLNEFILSIQKALKGPGREPIQFRTIFAGRYISEWEQQYLKLPIVAISLKPFDLNVIQQTIQKLPNEANIEYEIEFASHLMYFTGGHPGCMATIIRSHFGEPISSMALQKNKDIYYNTVAPLIKEIKNHIPYDLVKEFDILSVVRQIDIRYLTKLVNNNNDDDALAKEFLDTLEKKLLNTKLITKEKSFLRDDISRRLLAIQLRKEQIDYFLEICQKTISLYNQELENNKIITDAYIIAVELLFQKLQYIHYKFNGENKAFYESLPDIPETGLDNIINKLLAGRDARSMMDNFIESLDNDWEFRFTYNYFFMDEEKDGYTKIINTIKEYQKK